jgi:predicted hydrolase (HD superfamily)
MSEPAGITVSTSQMYGLLLSMDGKLTKLTIEVAGGASTIRDHETRIREIEQREDLSRRVAEMEATMKQIQQRLWAFPSLAGLIAAVALVAAFSDKF